MGTVGQSEKIGELLDRPLLTAASRGMSGKRIIRAVCPSKQHRHVVIDISIEQIPVISSLYAKTWMHVESCDDSIVPMEQLVVAEAPK